MTKEITLVRNYFNMAIRFAAEARALEDRHQDQEKSVEQVLLAHVMTVAAVENFLTCYLFPLAEGRPLERQFRIDLGNHLPLEARLRRWPDLLFDHALQLDQGPCRAFMEGKERRNALMHLNPADERASVSGLDDLTAQHADMMIEGAFAVIDQILFLQGLDASQSAWVRKLWTGQS